MVVTVFPATLVVNWVARDISEG